jgi:hypothetical protein
VAADDRLSNCGELTAETWPNEAPQKFTELVLATLRPLL